MSESSPRTVTRRWIQHNRSVVFIAAATAFSLLGDQVLYAVLPVYYADLGLTPIQVGILLSANRWIRLLTNELAHRLGRGPAQRAIFLGAFALGALTTAAYLLSNSFFSNPIFPISFTDACGFPLSISTKKGLIYLSS